MKLQSVELGISKEEVRTSRGSKMKMKYIMILLFVHVTIYSQFPHIISATDLAGGRVDMIDFHICSYSSPSLAVPLLMHYSLVSLVGDFTDSGRS